MVDKYMHSSLELEKYSNNIYLVKEMPGAVLGRHSAPLVAGRKMGSPSKVNASLSIESSQIEVFRAPTKSW